MSSQTLVLLDVDGVLVDWYTAAGELFGYPKILENSLTVWDNSHDICPRINTDYEKLWAKIEEQGVEWWVDLAWLPWGGLLLYSLSHYCDTYLCTSPAGSPTAAAGKLAWARTIPYLDPQRVLPMSHKELLAAPGRILIDDHIDNVNKFTRAGGTGILFPAKWNGLRWVLNDPVQMRRWLTVLIDYCRDPSKNSAPTQP
jgi:5'(3')-deoxyribonucleotidase